MKEECNFYSLSAMAPQMDGESYWMRGVHKCQAQPLVPLGIAATVGFFAASMRVGIYFFIMLD